MTTTRTCAPTESNHPVGSQASASWAHPRRSSPVTGSFKIWIIVPAAQPASQTPRWFICHRVMLLFGVNSGNVELVTTDRLSQNTSVAPSIGTPNIQSLYPRRFRQLHRAAFITMNSEPNVDILTVFCLFEYHKIGTWHSIQIEYHTCVFFLATTWQPAWYVSQHSNASWLAFQLVVPHLEEVLLPPVHPGRTLPNGPL